MSIFDDSHQDGYQRAREQFGGTNRAAVFFGWLTAITVTVLLSIAVAVIGAATGVTIDPNSRQFGATGVTGALVLTVVLLASCSTGGYVAGRMCRFDGGRQGMAVWLIGLATALVALGVGMALGREYPVAQLLDLPGVAVPKDLSVPGAFTAAMILASTLLGAMAGGALGQRYHAKVDRVR